jgi:hypothetical protein
MIDMVAVQNEWEATLLIPWQLSQPLVEAGLTTVMIVEWGVHEAQVFAEYMGMKFYVLIVKCLDGYAIKVSGSLPESTEVSNIFDRVINR